MGNVRSKRLLINGLLKKGFMRDVNADHIYFYWFDADGNPTDVQTKISHGATGETIGSNLIAKMARQCRITTKQFLDLIDCRLSPEQYGDILRQKNVI